MNLKHLLIFTSFYAAMSLNSPAAPQGAVDAAAPASALTAFVSALDYGARGDGMTDDTKAVQAALDACAADGGTVLLPSGRYLIGGHLVVPPYVTLRGTFSAPAATSHTTGTILLAFEGRGNVHAEPFITLNRCSTLRGLQVFYPEQEPENITPYPWCVRGYGDNIAIRDVLLINPYLGVDFGTFPAGRHWINGLYGQALKTGLFVDKCLDVGRVENVHFWPFWSETAMKWSRQHGTAFVIAKTDWQYMTNCFCISYAVGYHFLEIEDGPGNAVLTQCGSDIGPIAVKVDSVQPHSGVSFVNSQIMAGVEIADTNTGPVKFTACGFWGVEETTDWHARVRGSGHVTFTGCHFTDWGLVNKESPAIIAESGGLTIDGCEFLPAGPRTRHIELWEDVEAAVITDNRFRSKPVILNRSEGQVEIANNVGGQPTRLMEALEQMNSDTLAQIWQKRMESAPLTSYSAVLRLASAQGLIGTPTHAELRRQLLESVKASAAGNSTAAPFARRAEDELALDLQKSPGRVATRAMRAAQPPAVDGDRKEEDWTEEAASFSLRKNPGGTADPLLTSARFMYDDEALYLFADLGEPELGQLRMEQTNRDGKIWMDDCLEFFIAPRRGTHRYYQLIINPNGAFYDGTGNLSFTSAAWDGSPEIKTGRSQSGWTVELRLPWKDLGVAPPKPGEIWGLDLRRFRFAGGERQDAGWAGARSGGANHHPEQFGFLRFE